MCYRVYPQLTGDSRFITRYGNQNNVRCALLYSYFGSYTCCSLAQSFYPRPQDSFWYAHVGTDEWSERPATYQHGELQWMPRFRLLCAKDLRGTTNSWIVRLSLTSHFLPRSLLFLQTSFPRLPLDLRSEKGNPLLTPRRRGLTQTGPCLPRAVLPPFLYKVHMALRFSSY